MAGARTEVHLTQCTEIGDFLSAMASISINGYAKLFTSIKVAQLALKHRMNKTQRQRVIVFVGHPISEDIEECETLGAHLRRNNVAIDIINFANPDNVPRLQALVNAANNSNNSNFLDVPMGASMITDLLFTSPILQGEDAQMAGNNAGGIPADGSAGMVVDAAAGNAGPATSADNQFGGINYNMDPELAHAIQISMQEERARQGEEAK